MYTARVRVHYERPSTVPSWTWMENRDSIFSIITELYISMTRMETWVLHTRCELSPGMIVVTAILLK